VAFSGLTLPKDCELIISRRAYFFAMAGVKRMQVTCIGRLGSAHRIPRPC
jgi:hypothetical protein